MGSGGDDRKWSAGDGSSTAISLEERYALLVEAVEDYAIFMLDPTGHVASWNTGAQKIKGYTPDEIIGRHFSVFYTEADIAAGKPQRELVLAEKRGRIEDEGWRVRRDGSRFWADVIVTAVRDPSGNLMGFAKVTRDMTDRMRLAELERADELSAQIQHAREAEQRRIARELHDDLGQQLTALKMKVAALEGRRTGIDAATLRLQSHELQRQIDTMMASVRRIASDLRPPMLDDLGLAEAVEWLAQEFTVQHRIRAVVNIKLDDLTLGGFAATAVFRIVQEALTNVARHAHASKVAIDIRAAGGYCCVTIKDNGVGADLAQPRAQRSLGLLGMRERARQLGGTITIDSAPGQGFRIEVALPLDAVVHVE
ncbi:MAG TPA: PAS domain-containing sensor histidine kinase [Paraburkholderia sp.]|nr:PAS domain-containing sensor histidine kinase [Paraburkholderia sp.]